MRLYKYDLHVHTSNVSGCGRISGGRTAELYEQAGYDGFVVTDHFIAEYFASLPGLSWAQKIDCFLGGYREARDRGEQLGLDVFLGLEIRFPGRPEDYLLYGLDERFLAATPDLLAGGLAGLREKASQGGFLVYQAHPFRPGICPADPGLLDGVEVYNGNPRHESRNHLARCFAVAHGLRMISGSDCHQPEDVGRGGIAVASRITDRETLLNILGQERIECLLGV